MRLIDEKGRLFGKINIIDLCLVLVIVLAIGGLFIKKNSIPKTQGEYKTITYSVVIKGVRKPTLEQLEKEIGQTLDITNTESSLGTVTDIKYEDAKSFVVDKNGKHIEAVLPEKYDITITIETEGTATSKAIFTKGGTQLIIGDPVNISSNTVETSGEIMEIKVGE